MAHIRRLGFIAGVLLSGWLYSLHYSGIGQGGGYAWIAPLIILAICIFLGTRRAVPSSPEESGFSAAFKAALAVTVIAAIVFNVGAYIFFKWVSPAQVPPFQAALYYSWIVLAMGMILSLVISLLSRYRPGSGRQGH